MTPYTHGGDVLTARARFGGDVLDCSANLNPLGMPPAVQAGAAAPAAGAAPAPHPPGRAPPAARTPPPRGWPPAVPAAAAAAAADSARYPDPLCRALRAAIAAHDGVAPEQVLCGGGAAELIFRLAYALRPRRALITAPAFSEYEEALTAAGCAVTRHPLRRENRFDVDGGLLDVIAPGVELVFLCTPNNPTGRLVDGALLRAAAEQCRAVGAVLAVDECFLPLSDGAGPGLAPCLAEHPNLLLLRAFTKSYAMAGLRLGYALSANGGLLERMAAAGPPWSVSTPAQAAGLAALEQCSDWPEKARALLASERPALSDGLTALGLEVVPGQANYLLFRAAGAADLKERMLMRGVLIRSCANYHGLGNDWYRVCVGQAEQNRRLLAALKEVL